MKQEKYIDEFKKQSSLPLNSTWHNLFWFFSNKELHHFFLKEEMCLLPCVAIGPIFNQTWYKVSLGKGHRFKTVQTECL